MNPKNHLSFTLLAVSFFAATAHAQSSLTMSDYLNAVKAQHEGIKSLEAEYQGYKTKLKEGAIVFSSTAFANAAWVKDQRETMNPSFMGAETKADSYSLGVGKNFSTGTNVKLSYNLLKTEIAGSMLAMPNYYNAGPVLEVTQSLWRNFAGSDWKAQYNAAYFQNQAGMWQAGAKYAMQMAEVELTYWRLGLAREIVKIQQSILERAMKIQNWASRRDSLRLADASDRYQAEAAVLGRQFEVKAAEDEERMARRKFNHLRGVDGETVAETLDLPTPAILERKFDSNPLESREDYLATKAQFQSQIENSAQMIEKNRPVLEAFASYGLNGKDPDRTESMSEGWTGDHPNQTIGVRFSFALDTGLSSDNKAGYRRLQEAARMSIDRRAKDVLEEWRSLEIQRDQALARYKMAVDLEAAQKRKAEHERDRLLRGRTTTYQVLLFEQDYANAELLRFKTQMELVQILTQLKVFGGSSEYR